MANHKSAKKRIRSNEAKRVQNRYQKVTVRSLVKSFRKTSDKAIATKLFPTVVSKLDKLAKKGVIHSNKAANLKSKLATHLSNMA